MTYRQLNALLLAICVVGSIFAIGYLQNTLGLEPCPLCIFQRIGLWVMGGFALIGLIFNPKGKAPRLVLWLGSLLGTLWGAGVAARHVWLQHLPPDQVPACGPGLNYWVETLPIMQVFEEVLKGSGECAEVDWTFLGLSIPMQTFILFVVIGLILLMQLSKIVKNRA
ncbi:MAG: disulfide bond formation protein B [Moraxella sp.]|nr:disulfide bond formation protein B [Moraxella sp.]